MSSKPIRLSRQEAKRHSADMTGKTVIITGATAGIGKETARSLAKMGANICFATRNEKKTQDTIEEIRAELTNGSVLEHKQLDLADLESVRRFPSLFGEDQRIDVLINNAGVAHETGVTKQGIELAFGINYLSHFLLTKGLMPLLREEESRIINVSSMGHMGAKRSYFDMSFEGPCSELRPQQRYERSKAAQVLFAKALQRRLDQKHIACSCTSLHPGGVRTGILHYDTCGMAALVFMLQPFLVEPPEGARTSVFLATTDRPDETAGRYFHYGLFRYGIYEKPGTALVNDERLQERLWQISEKFIGEPFHIGAD